MSDPPGARPCEAAVDRDGRPRSRSATTAGSNPCPLRRSSASSRVGTARSARAAPRRSRWRRRRSESRRVRHRALGSSRGVDHQERLGDRIGAARAAADTTARYPPSSSRPARGSIRRERRRLPHHAVLLVAGVEAAGRERRSRAGALLQADQTSAISTPKPSGAATLCQMISSRVRMPSTRSRRDRVPWARRAVPIPRGLPGASTSARRRGGDRPVAALVLPSISTDGVTEVPFTRAVVRVGCRIPTTLCSA
jgi:hypothetical protein